MIKTKVKIELSDGSVEELGYSRLISISVDNKGISDVRTPSYGIILPSASFEFKDTDGSFLQKLNADLADNSKVKFYNYEEIDGVKVGSDVHIATFGKSKYNYDAENKTVRCTLSSSLEDTKNIVIEDNYIRPKKIEEKVVATYFLDILEDMGLGDILDIPSFIRYSASSKYPFLDSGKSVFYHIEKYCKAFGKYGYVGYNNENEIFKFMSIDY